MKNIPDLKLLLAFLFLANYHVLNAQLTGTKNIPGDYPSIATAIADLNIQGTGTGGVVFAVAAGYTETLTSPLSITATGTASDPIIFRKNGPGNNPLIISYTGGTNLPYSTQHDGMWRLVGSDYVTIDGFDLKENAANTVYTSYMEYAFALYKENGTNGCQHDTIRNCTITLNRNNSALGAIIPVSGSVGISSTNTTPAAVGTEVTVTDSNGANSYNAFYGNTIQTCHLGISVAGSANINTVADVGNAIGGTYPGTGNTILNYAGGGSTATFAIYTLNQKNARISQNIITNNDGAGSPPQGNLWGILTENSAGENTSIQNNHITLKGGMTGVALTCLESRTANRTGLGPTPHYTSIINNTIADCQYTTGITGTFTGIKTAGYPAILHITGNHLTNNAVIGFNGMAIGINNTGEATDSICIRNNTIEGMQFLSNQDCKVIFRGILNTGGAENAAVDISANDFGTLTYADLWPQGDVSFIYNGAGTRHQSVNYNTFTNIVISTMSNVSLIRMYNTMPDSGERIIEGNKIIGQFRQNGSMVLYGYYSTGASNSTTKEVCINNNFSNMHSAGTQYMYVWKSDDGKTTYPYGPKKIIQNNTFENISTITDNLYIINVKYAGDTSASMIRGNIIKNISDSTHNTNDSELRCISTNFGSYDISENILGNVYIQSDKAAGIVCEGNYTRNKVFKNKIHDFTIASSLHQLRGIHLTGSGNDSYVYNNSIGNLKGGHSFNEFSSTGIYINGAVNAYVYYNTVYLADTTTYDNQYRSASFMTGPNTAHLDLRNNIFINKSRFPNTGKTIAFYNGSTTLNAYSVYSNNNIFYAGPPSARNLIYLDAAGNSDQTLAGFQTRVGPRRDSLSATEDTPFMSLTGNAADFLHLDYASGSLANNRAQRIPGIDDDIDNDIRQGSFGYMGGDTDPDIGADESPSRCLSLQTTGSDSVCAGNSAVLAASGNGNISWYSEPVGGTYLGSGPLYTTPVLYGTSVFYAQDSACPAGTRGPVTVPIKALPEVIASAGPAIVCTGSSLVLDASGAVSYTWSGGFTNGIPFIPDTSAVYRVTGIGTNGCSNSDTIVVNVVPLPNVTAVADQNNVCAYTSVTLTGSGASSYTWSGGINNGVAFPVSSNSTYTVTGTDSNSCTNTAQIHMTVLPLPEVIAQAGDSVICLGEEITFSSSGNAAHYSWSDGIAESVPYIPAATGTHTYILTGTNSNSCTNSDTVTVTVLSGPPVYIIASDTAVCDGDAVTLSGAGALTYSWTNNIDNGISFVPAQTERYTLTGTDTHGCVGETSILITVNPHPDVIAAVNDSIVCEGEEIIFTGQGANGYNWTNGVINGQPYRPATTATYRVEGTDINGCVNSAEITVTVKSLPRTDLSVTGTVLSVGQNSALYRWIDCDTDIPLPGELNQTFTASANGNYAVIVDLEGCIDTSACTAVTGVTLTVPENADGGHALTISPNPSNGIFMIQGATGNYYLIDNRQVIKKICILNSQSYLLNLDDFPSGIYYLVKEGDNRSVTNKLILIK